MDASPLRNDTGAPGRTPSLRALLLGEIMVGTIMNILFNFLFAWLLFPIGPAIPLWGARGLALDTVPASVVPAVMMTLIVSAIMRRRLHAGLRVATEATLPIRLPDAPIVRAVVIGMLAIVLVALPTVAVLAAIWQEGSGWAQLIPFKILFSVFHAAMITPIVVIDILHRHRS